MTYPFSTPTTVTKYEQITETPERAMVIFAHPDDAEIGAGATAALWASRGCEITYVQCTTGSSGSNDIEMTSERIVAIRAAEQRAAADAIGVSDIVILNHPDGELEADRVFLGEVVHALRKYRPQVVFTHDQHRVNGFQHRDHRHVGITVQDAIYPYARDHLHFSDQLVNGLEPYKVKHLFFWGADQSDVIVDVSDSVDTKIDALSKHESQIPGLSFGSDMDRRMRSRHEDAAKGYGFKYGEIFRRLTARA
ncbi:MAG: PIG-L family deacetylase [Chloroflexi bacterium]|nr:PIG-L family deacetylase [Chloroflexota bacterium]